MRILIVTLMLLLIMAGPASAQDDACFNKGGTYDEDGNCIVSMGVDVSLAYPLSDNFFVQDQLDIFLFNMRAEFLGSWMQYGINDSYGIPWSLEVQHESFAYDEPIVSYRFDIYTFTGGAHPNSDFETFNFDLRTERILRLDDMFQADVDIYAILEPIARQQILENLGEFADPASIDLGLGTDPANYENWIAAPEALLLYFPPYQVAPYAAGPQMVSIPWADLATYLHADFVR